MQFHFGYLLLCHNNDCRHSSIIWTFNTSRVRNLEYRIRGTTPCGVLASFGSSLTNPASVPTLFYHNFMYSEASNQSVSAIPESDRVFFFLIFERALLANWNKHLGYLGHMQDRRKSSIKN